MNAGMHAATAVIAALYCRKKTGIGQRIDISMTDCLFSLHENTLPWFLLSDALGKPVEPPKIGRLHPGYAPHGIYKGQDGYIVIACLTEPRWAGLLRALGQSYEWLRDDPRTANVSIRCTGDNAPFIHKTIEEWVLSHDSVAAVEKKLEENGVPCLRVRTLKELADTDPQIKAREMLVEVEQPFIGRMKMYGSPLKMSETPCGVTGHGPFLGEHNREILMTFLGYSQSRVEALYRDNIIHHEPAVDRLS